MDPILKVTEGGYGVPPELNVGALAAANQVAAEFLEIPFGRSAAGARRRRTEDGPLDQRKRQGTVPMSFPPAHLRH
jgi:hypothetical protein